MRTTVTLAGNYKITPFELMQQDTDEVIMLINYLVELGREPEQGHDVQPQRSKSKDTFWDF